LGKHATGGSQDKDEYAESNRNDFHGRSISQNDQLQANITIVDGWSATRNLSS
jgi:hypothetical protein